MKPLSTPLPLRTTAALGNFHTIRTIPHRYGITVGELLPINVGRTLFVWADHAVKAIDSVTVDGLPVSGWTWRNVVDEESGRAIAVVQFAESVDANAQLAASGRGKLLAGVVMENPADIAADIFTMAGRADLSIRLTRFRAACAAAGLRCAGSLGAGLAGGVPTAQGALRSVCASVGGYYSPRGREPCWLAGQSSPVSTVAARQADAVKASASLSDIATVALVQYAHDDTGPTRSMRLVADIPSRKYGEREVTLSLPFVGDARTALSVGTAELQRAARGRWNITVDGIRSMTLRTGDSVYLDTAVLPDVSRVDLVSCSSAIDAGLQSFAAFASVGIVPSIRLVLQSSRFTPDAYTGVSITTQGDQRVIELENTDGTPIADASVTLNGEITRQSDGAGRVSFPVALMPRGTHTLTIITSDDPPRTLTAEVIVQ